MYKGPVSILLLLFIVLQCPVSGQNADINLLKPINKNETTFKNAWLGGVASSDIPLSLGLPVGIAIAGFIRHDDHLKQDALYMGAGFFISSAITISVKKLVNRPRPFVTYPFIIKRDSESGSESFPSGHTATAFCTATELALRYPYWYVIVPSYLFATSVGWARMYQGVHYPSDVLAGALAGAGSAWLGWKLQKWMQGRPHKKR